MGLNLWMFQLGDRGSGIWYYNGEIQDFEEIQRQCRESGRMFEDSKFPCSDEVLPITEPKSVKPVIWLRPSVKSRFIHLSLHEDSIFEANRIFQEIEPSPRFFVDDKSRFDVRQGDVGKLMKREDYEFLSKRDVFVGHSERAPLGGMWLSSSCGRVKRSQVAPAHIDLTRYLIIVF